MPANLDPIGFWSYTSSDDSASRGHLSQLRRLLADDLQRLIGREPQVHIFQDVAAIPKGASWEAEIHKALEAASFIIPILTPAFLQSEWCCREVLHFREREQTLGRDNLIFPFHFTDTTHVDPDDIRDVFDKSVWTLLRSRQVTDFRKLELEDPNHRDVRFKLRELTESIRNALRPPRLAPNGVATGTVAQPDLARVPVLETAVLSTPPVVQTRPLEPEVARPRKPAWAAASGTDQFGTWAEIAVPAIKGPPVTQRMRLIPAGRFTMGSPGNEPGRWDGEGPRQQIAIAEPFWLFDTPCTQALWEAVMGENPSHFKGPDRPVETVSFTQVQDFLTRVNALMPGLNLALPSEAAWEYACRAGTSGPAYAADLTKIAWHGLNSGGQTHPVGKLQPNAWGLYDMLGNVWEWCADAWQNSHAGAAADGAPRTGGSAAGRVVRGGAWDFDAGVMRAASRDGDVPGNRGYSLGFRCARVQ